MKKIISLLLIIASFISSAHGEETLDATKKQQIDQLLTLTGSEQLEKNFSTFFSQQIIAAMKESQPSVEPKTLAIVESEIKAIVHDEFANKKSFQRLLYPIYDRNLSSEDLAELIRFYQTPVGKKFVATLPVIQQETVLATQRWGQDLAPRIQQQVMARFKQEGISFSPQEKSPQVKNPPENSQAVKQP